MEGFPDRLEEEARSSEAQDLSRVIRVTWVLDPETHPTSLSLTGILFFFFWAGGGGGDVGSRDFTWDWRERWFVGSVLGPKGNWSHATLTSHHPSILLWDLSRAGLLSSSRTGYKDLNETDQVLPQAPDPTQSQSITSVSIRRSIYQLMVWSL